MKNIRIGSGAGFAGDRIEPAIDLINDGRLDYIIFECLAERTIALAQQSKQRDPESGFDPLLPDRMSRVLPALHRTSTRLVSNMGAANPLGAASKIRELAIASGLSGISVAAVTGDDVTDRIDDYRDLETLESGQPLRTIAAQIISANAYTGAGRITESLRRGANIVITGRAADPALTVGPLVLEFDRPFDDFDFLGKATAAGHLLECGSQVTGGYFADPGYKDVPELWNVGFPIATFGADGTIRISKLPGTGGTVSKATATEQLLYEIHDPSAYVTPDVVADFSRMSVHQDTDDTVVLNGATGRQKTGKLKVSIGYRDGYIGEGEISYGGPGALSRARLAAEVIRRRLQATGADLREIRVDFIGYNSLFGVASGETANGSVADRSVHEVRLRVAGRADSIDCARKVGREVEALYTNGPAGGGGARATVRETISIASILIPESDVDEDITYLET